MPGAGPSGRSSEKRTLPGFRAHRSVSTRAHRPGEAASPAGQQGVGCKPDELRTQGCEQALIMAIVGAQALESLQLPVRLTSSVKWQPRNRLPAPAAARDRSAFGHAHEPSSQDPHTSPVSLGHRRPPNAAPSCRDDVLQYLERLREGHRFAIGQCNRC